MSPLKKLAAAIHPSYLEGFRELSHLHDWHLMVSINLDAWYTSKEPLRG